MIQANIIIDDIIHYEYTYNHVMSRSIQCSIDNNITSAHTSMIGVINGFCECLCLV